MLHEKFDRNRVAKRMEHVPNNVERYCVEMLQHTELQEFAESFFTPRPDIDFNDLSGA